MLTISRSVSGRVPGVRELTAATKGALQTAVEAWHRQFMPNHFTVEGGKKYGYKPRKGDDEPPRIPTGPGGSLRANQHYSWRKRRQKGHNKPLVWTGESEHLAKSSVRFKVVANRASESLEGRAILSLPSYFYMYRIDLNQPDKADELTRTAADEAAILESIFQGDFARRLQSSV